MSSCSPFSQKNVQKCLCGAEACRGILGPKVGDRPKVRLENDNQVAGTKRKSKEISRDSSRLDDNLIDGEPSCVKKAKKQHKSLSSTAKKAATLFKNAIVGDPAEARKRVEFDRQHRVQRAARRLSSHSSTSPPARDNRDTTKSKTSGKLKAPFQKMMTEVKDLSSSSSSGITSNSKTNTIYATIEKRKSFNQTMLTDTNNSKSSLQHLVSSSSHVGERGEGKLLNGKKVKNRIGRLSTLTRTSSAAIGAGRLVKKGTIPRGRTVSGVKVN